MALTKRVGLGVVLSCDPAGGVAFVALGAVVEAVEGADTKGAVYENALLTDKYATKGVGQIDPGEVTFTIAYDPLDTATTTVLTSLLTSSAIANWQIAYPVIGTEVQQKETFLAAVSGFKRSIQKSKMITAHVALAVSGKPGYTGN